MKQRKINYNSRNSFQSSNDVESLVDFNRSVFEPTMLDYADDFEDYEMNPWETFDAVGLNQLEGENFSTLNDIWPGEQFSEGLKLEAVPGAS